VYSPNMVARPIIEDQDMMTRRHLAEAEDHIALSNRIIRRQRELIKKREREGHDTAQSLVLLNTFLDSHSLHVRERDRLLRHVHLLDGKSPPKVF